MDKKLYLVEVMSTFRMRYVVEAREESHALDEVTLMVRLTFIVQTMIMVDGKKIHGLNIIHCLWMAEL